ncbi:cysteine synthase A [Natranaerobius trueperi]|uniref:Cysteine synthase n=1 Tax=Natranaerobius trueperi TaxID=759412 RepID=A0A226BXH2_9FIRM|nr:cysteine synthase A [Natranaerobius trueperi]OWZ82899.1 cysteine synthase A [Natranaerobius trueperi]
MKVANDMTELVGLTPMVYLNRLVGEESSNVLVKLEMFNPSGSVKDRAAYNMIREAERLGELPQDGTIIEPTSGNTGIGLAMNAAAKGYNIILVMPDTMTKERIKILEAYGAQVVLTPGEKKMPGAIEKAKELAKEIPGSFIPQQFENMANPDIHRYTTAKEIINQLEQENIRPDAFVATAGTGGTVTGTGEILKKQYPDLQVYVVEPESSPVLSGGSPGKHKLVGTSPGFIPDTLNQNIYNDIIQCSDDNAYQITRNLAKKEGILVGPSSGASCYGALKVANKLGPDKTVICIAPDTGERYLSSDIF